MSLLSIFISILILSFSCFSQESSSFEVIETSILRAGKDSKKSINLEIFAFRNSYDQDRIVYELGLADEVFFQCGISLGKVKLNLIEGNQVDDEYFDTSLIDLGAGADFNSIKQMSASKKRDNLVEEILANSVIKFINQYSQNIFFLRIVLLNENTPQISINPLAKAVAYHYNEVFPNSDPLIILAKNSSKSTHVLAHEVAHILKADVRHHMDENGRSYPVGNLMTPNSNAKFENIERQGYRYQLDKAQCKRMRKVLKFFNNNELKKHFDDKGI